MNIKQVFEAHPAWQKVADSELTALLEAAQPLTCDSQASLTAQYHPAKYFYFVNDGRLRFSIQLDNSDEQLVVARSARTWCAVGWSGFREPYRYATSVKCEQACQLLRWQHTDLQRLFEQYPELGFTFLTLVLQTGDELLHQVRQLLVSATRPFGPPMPSALAEKPQGLHLNRETVLSWLQRSAFFEGFTEEDLEYLAGTALLEEYASGERLFTQSRPAAGIYLLVSGSVALYCSAEKTGQGEGEVFIRTLDSPGQIVAWSTDFQPRNPEISSLVSQDTLVCFIAEEFLSERMKHRPQFGLTLAYRLLFLTGNQLRSMRIQLVHQQYDEESFSIRNLLEQSSPELGVTSLLHEVPHLLSSRLTHGRVFESLQQLKQQGNQLEKNLAGLCTDILAETRREWNFYNGLLNVYETVVSSPRQLEPRQVRQRCVAAFQQAFDQVRYVIEGKEHLPDEPGCIFILNHLISHPYHVLPNHFELALDTHFVSAMILDPKYGDGGVRIVRQPRNEEFAHQNYYKQLGNIFVVTGESDEAAQTGSKRSNRLEEFISTTRDCLQAGNNLVICPEGTSLWSEESPGLFKPGAFILAGSMEPEPLIVPVAVANFDKRLRHTTLAAVIKPPFYISDHVDVTNKENLAVFLADYRETYRGYVEEAQRLA
jgi:CRP-like cAMP-binding protein